jgi:hypothetical protein
VKVKAKAWLSQLQDKGGLTVEMASLSKENALLKGSVETMQRQIANLTAMVQKSDSPEVAAQYEPETISANDILEDEPVVPREQLPVTTAASDLAAQYEAKFGKPPHHRMKLETIEAALKG